MTMMFDNMHRTDDNRLLDNTTAQKVIDRVKTLSGETGALVVSVQSWWSGAQRWARNRATMTSDQQDISVYITRALQGAACTIRTNQIDPDALKSAIAFINSMIDRYRSYAADPMELESPKFAIKGIPVWSDTTFNHSAEENGQLVKTLTQRSEEAGLLSAGYIETIGARIVRYSRDAYGKESQRTGEVTQAQCSVTVRHPKGTGSGWAGNTSFDLTRISIPSISERAFEKCRTSIDAVRIEPGRYQTILEPPATGMLANIIWHAAFFRSTSEQNRGGAFLLGYDQTIDRYRSKLGLQVIDPRISLVHDPEDPIVGTHPEAGIRRIEVIKNGILTTLMHDYGYAQRELYRRDYDAMRNSFMMTGGDTSIDEMIATTKRGLLVTRFSNPVMVDFDSLLLTGLTRDGLWLIENGKISKAVRNFRFTESPLFAFNNVVQLGQPEPTFSPYSRPRFPFMDKAFHDTLTSIIAPAIKVNDFSFTSTIDAV